MLEISPDGKVLQANACFLDDLGHSLDEVVGKHHRAFRPRSIADKPADDEVWRTLRSGGRVSQQIECVAGNGQTVWLQATYSPIFDEHGALERVIEFAFDVTPHVQRELAAREREHLLSLVANQTDNAIIITDMAWRIIYVNAAFTRMFGYELDEVLGGVPSTLLTPYTPKTTVQNVRQTLQEGRPQRSDDLVYGKHGQRFWCSITGNALRNDQGELQHTVSVLTDITDAKMHEVIQRRVLEAMVQEGPLADVMNLLCREVERIAPEVIASVLKVDEAGKLATLAAPSLPDELAHRIDQAGINAAAWCGEASSTESVVDLLADERWIAHRDLIDMLSLKACWSTPIRSKEGRVVGIFAFYFRELALPDEFHRRLVAVCQHLCALALEREVAQSQIRQLVFYDPLTALPNRSLLHVQAEQAIASALRHQESLAVLFIDLDRFKQINDTLGHPAGDTLLCTVAQRIREQIRNADVVGRLSGDEFVVVLPECDAVQATDVAERIQAALANPFLLADVTVTPSASIGISLLPNDGQDMETLLRRADMAMYQAKTKSRGTFSFFREEMNLAAQEKLALESALRKALPAGDLRLHYQPQVDLNDRRVYGLEALARWHHPTLGHIPPTRFVAVAQECGLITELGRWAVNEACRQLGDWKERGVPVPGVSVNLSPTNFHDLELPRMIADILQRHSLIPGSLTLEITEDVLMDANPSTLTTLHALHAQGVRLSMDDFGIGYSSLSYLRRLPLNELKLDKSFVRDLEYDHTSRALSNAVLRIGESLNLTVVAEGVETEAQRAVLLEMGYRAAQGYLFSRPMPADALESWLMSLD
ncbi:sensor domain-containing protein [Pigmentiphaga aceris]|uniref:sensor domain-containing protein n=1 Tax=Pigmentiphaga aceris TaxID=1940612 RepID=UPI001FE3CA68